MKETIAIIVDPDHYTAEEVDAANNRHANFLGPKKALAGALIAKTKAEKDEKIAHLLEDRVNQLFALGKQLAAGPPDADALKKKFVQTNEFGFTTSSGVEFSALAVYHNDGPYNTLVTDLAKKARTEATSSTAVANQKQAVADLAVSLHNSKAKKKKQRLK